MTSFRLLLVALLVLVSFGAIAEQRVAVLLRFDGVAPVGAVVRIEARSAHAAVAPVIVETEAADPGVSLAAGQWFLRAVSAGYWGEAVLVAVGDAPVEVTLPLYRAARVTGEVEVPAPAVARAVDVHFNPVDPDAHLPSGSVSCAVVDRRIDCELPAGAYDLAFCVPGHISLYRWDVALRDSVDVGKLTFRAGSTVSGRVEWPRTDERLALETIRVTLRNAVHGDRNDAARNRESVTALVAHPNARGFFAFHVPAGRYVVAASAPGLLADERQVTVIDGREAVLESPLMLEPPRTLIVNVRVPDAGRGQPWKVAITRFDDEAQPLAATVIDVPADGVCRFADQRGGAYAIELRLREGVWGARQTFLDRDTTIELPVRIVQVRGSTRLGDQPLAARLEFVSRANGFHVATRTRADGTFLLFLPDIGERWDEVEIQSDAPLVKRVLEDVPLARGDDGIATMTLALPAARIEGVVVDERKRPAGRGLIDIAAPDGFRQIEMTDGTFTVHGVAPGRYALKAATRERESEEAVVLEMGEGDERRDVVLVVAPVSQLRGSVTSASGPAIGASLFVSAVQDATPILMTIPVDTTGAFDVRLPPQTRDVVVAVAAPGFAFRMMRMPVTSERLDLRVDQSGGVLTIDGAVGMRAEPRRPYLLHNGAVMRAVSVAYLSRARPLGNFEERVQFEIPSAEEGTHTLCLLSGDEQRAILLGARPPESRCVAGVLARHGALTLRAPEPETRAGR